MALIFNPTTKALTTGNTPDYKEGGIHYDASLMVLTREWFDTYSLPDCEQKYWKQDGNDIVEMTPEEKDAVDNPPEAPYLIIYDYIDENTFHVVDRQKPPKNFPYNILPLYKKETIETKGDVLQIIYYAEYDDETDTFSTPVLKEDRVYNMTNGIYVSRPMNITWYWNDGSECVDTKDKPKRYTKKKGMTAIKRKRANIIDKLSYDLIGYLIMTGVAVDEPDGIVKAKAYLDDIDPDVSKYLHGTEDALINNVTNDSTHTWLNNPVTQAGGQTIRALILNEIDY